MKNSMMEKALYVSRKEHLICFDDTFSRIYFGNEFCQRLLSSLEDIEGVVAFSRDHAVPLTVVTGIFTDTKLDQMRRILEYLSGRQGYEIVVNDWGAVHLIGDYDVTPVAGRLLTKQRRSPRLMNLIDSLPQSMQIRLQEAAITQPLVELLESYRIERVEIDNLLQGIRIDRQIQKIVNISLYVPYGYVTTTRLCLSNAANRGNDMRLGILPCRRECRTDSFTLKHTYMPQGLLLRGNTLFFKNDTIPRLDTLGIDRLVYQPYIPF